MKNFQQQSNQCTVEEKGWFGKVTKPCAFEEVYDYSKAEGLTSEDISRMYELEAENYASDAVSEILEQLRSKTFVGVYCLACGKFIERPKNGQQSSTST